MPMSSAAVSGRQRDVDEIVMYGDYDKLSKLYELSLDTVKKAVNNTLAIMSQIHQFIGANNNLPEWLYPQNDDGSFDMAS